MLGLIQGLEELPFVTGKGRESSQGGEQGAFLSQETLSSGHSVLFWASDPWPLCSSTQSLHPVDFLCHLETPHPGVGVSHI